MKKPSNYMLKKWAEMTDYNNHYGVRIDIAKWAQLENETLHINNHINHISYVKAFEELLDSVESRGIGLPNAQIILTNMMMQDIRRIYGEEVYRKINKCL